MKKRIITAVVLVPVLLLVVLAAPKILTGVVWGLLLAIGAYELLYRTGLVTHPRMVIYSGIMAFAISMWSSFGAPHAAALLGLMVFTIALFAEVMLDHVKVRFSDLAMCIVAGALVPFLLTSVVRILMMHIGRYMVLIPFIVAFLNDAGAYFAGRYFGKHKMSPVISQHKTVEGAIGGVLTAMVGMVLYGLILQLFFDFRVHFFVAILYGFLGAAVGIFGDLCFSVIKRQTGIKDYGNLIPGHGGVLDRFDSMMLVGPLMEALMLILPMVV